MEEAEREVGVGDGGEGGGAGGRVGEVEEGGEKRGTQHNKNRSYVLHLRALPSSTATSGACF